MSARRGPKRPIKRSFGSVRQLKSGRWQARYTGPDGVLYTARTNTGKPLTFLSRGDAEMWLSLRQSEIVRNEWRPPAEPEQTAEAPMTFAEFADAWLADRDLAVRTREHYRQLLDDHIYPTFGDMPVAEILPAAVRKWHAQLAKTTGPTARAHSYALLRTICNTAIADDLIGANPCRIRGGGVSKRKVRIKPATVAELGVIVTSIPARYRLMILLAAWCALRFGELAALRRSSVDLDTEIVHVETGIVVTEDGQLEKDPKTEAGKREVHIPPHLIPVIKAHLRDHAAMGKDGLLFPGSRSGAPLRPGALYKVYYPARAAAGRPDLRFHDLRHTGAVLAASTGATLAELMARLGHSSPSAAMRYQHAAKERDKEIAALLSGLAEAATVTPIEEAKKPGRKKGRKSA